MKPSFYLSQIWIKNRAPFGDLRMQLAPAEVALLSALNGKGKTTVLSYIADAIYELAKTHFRNIAPQEGHFYRIATSLDLLKPDEASILYLRFMCDDEPVDFVDVRRPCTAEQYKAATADIPNPIDFAATILPALNAFGIAKTASPNWKKELAQKVFDNNVLTFFPAYRFEVPEYLNESFQKKLTFKQGVRFDGILDKPIESTTAFPQIANWLMDVVLDCRVSAPPSSAHQLFANVNKIITLALSAKHPEPLRLGIGPRNYGATRIQVLTLKEPSVQVYPTLFRLSSGEQALLTLFAEVLRQADTTQPDIALHDISGLVLIDEIDKHLHIKLQKEVLPILLVLFPRVQFIASSHSPFLGMGIAEAMPARGRLIDLGSGLTLAPTNDPLYQEVYEMMLKEEARYLALYNDIQTKIDTSKKLQIITEGANTEHIRKALEVLAPELTNDIQLVSEAKDKTGAQQLKNAFVIMAAAKHTERFLFVWDCEVQKEYDSVTEGNNCWKYRFPTNPLNTIATKGVENNFPQNLFLPEMYETITLQADYGEEINKKQFSKPKFLAHVLTLNDPETFANFSGLITKIKDVLTK